MCKASLAIAAALVIWLGSSLVRVENERYALSVGMCWGKLGVADLQCLSAVQTRTHWAWHLYYALAR